MIFEDSKWLIAIIVLAIAYLTFRIFIGSNKNQKRYQQHIEKILNSEEYKVKGKFE